jgi:hypothetical protein
VIDRFAWRIFPMPGNQPSSGRTRLIRFNGSRLGLKQEVIINLKKVGKFFFHQKAMFWVRIRIGYGFHQVSGSGSMRAKMTYKNGKK